MPIDYARSLTAGDRSLRSDRHLGFGLAFVAGAVNAGAFLAVGIYTSHMTGLVSSLADHLALGDVAVALGALGAVLAFLLGAVTSSLMINFARSRNLRSRYALPLLLEALLLLAFGLLGATLAPAKGFFVPLSVGLLCFMMGLQNAVITKASGAVIRTTHLTGVITDLGIEVGRLLAAQGARRSAPGAVAADAGRLAMLARLCVFFLLGGVLGALGFKYVGYLATLPLAGLLLTMSVIPIIDDLRRPRAPAHDA